MKKVYVVLLATATVLQTGCGAMTRDYPSFLEDGSRGRILISADAEGMRAYGDSQNALITNGKASPDKATAAWNHREKQEVEITTRKVRGPKDFLNSLFFGESAPVESNGTAPTEQKY